MQFFTIIRIIGVLVMSFSLTMLLPAFVALIYGDGGGREFLQSFAFTFFAGATLWWLCRHSKTQLRSREGFLIVVLFWIVLGCLGAIPFILLELQYPTHFLSNQKKVLSYSFTSVSTLLN